MKRIFIKIFFLFIVIFLILTGYLFIGNSPRAEKITWGVNFSQKHSELLGLNWRENYTALIDDLKTKKIKIITHWDLIEPEEGKYDFKDLDWQIKTAEENEVGLILVTGMKTGRWPECHIPEWAENLNKKEQQEKVLELLKETVLRYRDSEAILFWQVENEAFFPFGECPWTDIDFLKKEINLVKSLDDRPIIITDSGEFSFWTRAARLGDMVGVTLHRKAWFREFKTYVSYPFTPMYYWRRAEIIRNFFNKKVINVELQAEPWGPTLLYWLPLEEHEITMDLEQFKKNVEFLKKTGFDVSYFWGVEWWYWMKEKQNRPEIWNEAKKLF